MLQQQRSSFFCGGEILSKAGITQGGPTSMRTYGLSILPMFHSLLEIVLTSDLQTRELADIKISAINYLQLVLSIDIFLNSPNHT